MKPNRGCKQVHYLLLTITLSILLTACGGGEGGKSGNSTNNNPPAATVSQGVLIDSAVEGVRFETPTQSGLTTGTGTFLYNPGEVVKFYIGDILLGSAPGAGMLTPIDLVPGAQNETNPRVINLLRFIQSLDSDATLTNGIQVSVATRTALKGQVLDFTLANAAFKTAFNTLSGAVLGSLALVTAADAQAHMKAFLNTLGGGSLGLGTLSVAGADTPTIGTSYKPDMVTPLFTATTATVAWMVGNTNAGNVGRLGGINIFTLNGQIVSLQYDLQDARNFPPLLSYSYNVSCSPIAAADCSKITFDAANRRLVLNNVQLVNRTSVLIDNQATGPITLNGTLSWN